MTDRIGYAAIAAAAVLWAVGGTYARRLTDAGIDVTTLVSWRAWISLAGLAAVVGVRRTPGRGRLRPVLPQVLAFGLALAGANFFYYLALSRIPVAVAIVVQYAAPALVVVWAAIAGRALPSARVSLAVTLAIAGVVLLSGVSGSGRGVDAIGLAAAVAAALSFAVYVLSGERVAQAVGTERGMLAAFAVASVFWLAVAAGRGVLAVASRFWFGVAFLGVLGTLVPFLLFVFGLERVSAPRASVVSTLEPLAAAALAWAWLGQSLTPIQVCGAALVLTGVAVVQSRSAPAVPAAD